MYFELIFISVINLKNHGLLKFKSGANNRTEFWDYFVN